MINEKHTLVNIKINKKIYQLSLFYKEFIEGLYDLFCLLLENPIENFWYECICITLGYFQLLIYILDETVSLIIIIFLKIKLVLANLESKFNNKRIT